MNTARTGLLACATAAAAALNCSAAQAAPKQPNVVVVLVDDFGMQDLGCYGSTFYETPNIDRLAKQGMLFTNSYSAHPVCSPTRAAMMTGKNPCRQEINITDWIPGMRPKGKKLKCPEINLNMPLAEVTIAERLQKAGYQTWFVGKWHLGRTEKHYPKAQGFDVNIGGWSRGGPAGGYYSPWKNPMLENGPEGEYLTDRLTNESINLIDKRDKDRPFFLYLSFYTVHTPIQACKRYSDKFQKKLEALPPFDRKDGVKDKWGITRLRQDNPDYATMVHAMDENVGRLLKTLAQQGLADNTVVLFTGDNGALTTGRTRPGPSCAKPFRAGKGWLYEGGIRVPLIIRDPSSSLKGAKCDVPVVNTDFYATILDFCGQKLDPTQHKDSFSLKALVEGKAKTLARTEPLIWHYPHYHGSGWAPGSAIRDGKWKLVQSYEDGSVELYDLGNDVGETTDVSSKFPEKKTELFNKMHEYFKKVGAQLPVLKAEKTTAAN